MPYAAFENEDDVTTGYAAQRQHLAKRLQVVLGKLWELSHFDQQEVNHE